MNKKSIFVYFFKKTSPLLIFFTLMTAIIASLCVISSKNFGRPANPSDVYYITTPPFALVVVTLCLTVYVFVLPSIHFHELKSKKSADVYLSLPLNLKNLVMIKILTSLLQLLISYLFSAFLLFITVFSKLSSPGYDTSGLIHYLWIIPLIFILLVALYFTCLFFYFQGNSDVDGILIQLLGFVSLYFISYVPLAILKHYQVTINSEVWMFLETCLSQYILLVQFSYAADLITVRLQMLTSIESWALAFHIIMALLLGGFSLFGVFFFLKHYFKAESIGDVSKSWFGYRLSLPIILASLVILLGFALVDGDFVFVGYAIVLVLVIGFYILISMLNYCKTPKLPVRFIISSLCVFALSLTISLIPFAFA